MVHVTGLNMGRLFQSHPFPSHGMGYFSFYGIFHGIPSHLKNKKLRKNLIFVPFHPIVFTKSSIFKQKIRFLSSTGVPVWFIVRNVPNERSKTHRTHEWRVISGETKHKNYDFWPKNNWWDLRYQKSQSHHIPSHNIKGWDGIFMGFP